LKKHYYILFAFIFVVLVFLQPLLYRSWGLNPDEGYFLFMGKSITNGAIPYIDYVDNKPPGIWYLMAANFQIFGASFYTARYILYFTNALSVIIMLLIGIKINNRKVGVTCPPKTDPVLVLDWQIGKRG
jgi:hypothetical protein